MSVVDWNGDRAANERSSIYEKEAFHVRSPRSE